MREKFVADAKQAFDAGIKPIRNNYCDANGCCCAMGAVLKNSGYNFVSSSIGPITKLRTEYSLPLKYLTGVMDGFDGFDYTALDSDEQYKNGVTDGKIIWEYANTKEVNV